MLCAAPGLGPKYKPQATLDNRRVQLLDGEFRGERAGQVLRHGVRALA